MKLTKPKILITGSSRGIGAATAIKSKLEGYDVILHGRSKTKHLINISRKLESEYIYFDLRKENEIANAFKEISKLDALVNSAGINISKSFLDLTESDWKSIYAHNVFGISNVIKYALPKLKKNNISRIVNIASVKGIYSAVGRVAYASSKAALINLTTGLAKELSPNILINCVSPGFTNTDMTNNNLSNRIQKQIDSILLGRVADPSEIAEVILFLCSKKCTYITGQNIIVDGGFSIKNV
tara:strand:+ start:1023 stop:1745 length:723 start_codon:yes stop_codon:yes gene_type:complete